MLKVLGNIYDLDAKVKVILYFYLNASPKQLNLATSNCAGA